MMRTDVTASSAVVYLRYWPAVTYCLDVSQKCMIDVLSISAARPEGTPTRINDIGSRIFNHNDIVFIPAVYASFQ